MIVVDASATVDLLLGTERAGAVAKVVRTVRELHAPELIDPEVMGVVRRWTFRGWADPERGERAVEELGELGLVRYRHASLRRRVWDLRDRCTTYDACYVALAETLGADLLTTDDRLRRAVDGLVTVR